jgi:hypothetical protein
MSDSFLSARSKIDRAKKHIAEVELIVTTLPNHAVATIEINPDGGNEVLKHDLLDRDKIINNIALALGDAIHNLHCALDHAWLTVLTELSPESINGQTKFPIRPERDNVEAALRGVKIDSTAPALFDLVLGKIKPYAGGDESIWSIHALDIDDKHRLLLPIIEYASIHGIEVEDKRGKVTSGGTWGTSQKPPYYVPIPLGSHFKEKGTVAFSVLFNEGPTFQFADIRDMLWVFIMKVMNVVQALENIVPIELGRRALIDKP